MAKLASSIHSSTNNEDRFMLTDVLVTVNLLLTDVQLVQREWCLQATIKNINTLQQNINTFSQIESSFGYIVAIQVPPTCIRDV